jgi:succinate dehydrogenase / fumarate reductase cytochrome b subunit
MSNTSRNFLQSSLGKKYVMGLTGLFLISFLIIHCILNSFIFIPDSGVSFNAGAEFMAHNPIIRIMEVVLFIGIVWHIVQALYLTIENRKARPVKYAVENGNANSKWYSRWMGLLGTLILLFLVIHLKHFWVVSRFTDEITGGHETLYDEMKTVFASPFVVIVYVLGVISLAYHLLHGFKSAFQSLGLNNKKYSKMINMAGLCFSIIIPLIFASMPIAFYFGFVK